MSKTIYIGGRLESKEKGNVVTGANAILDDTKGKKQNVINKETDDELARLEQSKQDNLNFDNAPTEDSTNPVTSGGVYTAEKALSDAIEAILLLIPSAATALNKLVDTNTMNSSISTATATFRGTYNAVSDLGLTYQATHAQIEAALDALGLTADNNDFAFVQIPVSDQSQDIAKTERFKFNGTNWLYEYDLNTSGFTAAQWAAINSTITLALVQKLAALPTNAELLQALGLKQDVLTFDNAPTTDSNNPVKSGGIKNAIDTAVGDEATDRENADTALSGLIGDEKTRAEGIEGGLDTRLGAVEGSVSTIQGVIPSEATSSNKLVDYSSMTTYIGTIIDNIDATFNVTSTDGHVTLAITQVNGVITSVQLTTFDIASAAALNLKASQADLTTLAGRVTTAEGNITSLTGRMTTAEGDIDQLLALYNALQQSAPQVIQPTDTWPVANPSTTVIYRVIDRVNTPPEYYSDYMWNGTSMVLMATYNNAVDTTPKKDSANLITSGGVFANIGAFDISEYHKSGSTLATYADLTAALAALPSDFQKGGMSIKFVQTSDNKYMQARCMAQNFTTDVTQWQGVDDEPTAGSHSLVESGGVGYCFDRVQAEIGYKIDEFIFSEAGEKPYSFVEGNTYVVTNTGNSGFNISIRETKDGESHDITFVGIGESVEITASINGYWVRVGRPGAFNIILKGNINSRLNAVEKEANQFGQFAKKEIVIKYIADQYLGNLSTFECYLNTTSGKVFCQLADGTRIEMPRETGYAVIYKGVILTYDGELDKWIPNTNKYFIVPTTNDSKVFWRTSNNKLIPVSHTDSEWGQTLIQSVKAGETIIIYGTGTPTSPFAILTDTNYNVLDTIQGEVGKAPRIIVAKQDGFIVGNYLSASEHYVLKEHIDTSIQLVAVVEGNPQVYYNIPYNYMDMYYNCNTKKILIKDDSETSIDITDYIAKCSADIDIQVWDSVYRWDKKRNRLDIPKRNLCLGVKDIEPLLPETIATYKSGISFNYRSFADELYAKFDSLITSYPDFVSKVDAVELANSEGGTLTYPEYANLGGVASGEYLPTPTYRTPVYVFKTPESVAVNQTTLNYKRNILIVSGNHPYEIAAPVNCYLFIKNVLDLLSSADEDIYKIMANYNIYILPCLNGYGIYHAQDGFMRINANGVNINRNFPTERWEQGSVGQDYGGDYAGSEFETQLVMALTNVLKPYIGIDAHNFDKAERQFFFTYMNIKMQDLGYDFFNNINSKLKKQYPNYFGNSFGYLTEIGSTIVIASNGSMSEWWSSVAKLPVSFTFEISRCINYDNGEIDPTTFIDDYGNTLFSCNECALRTIMYLALNMIDL